MRLVLSRAWALGIALIVLAVLSYTQVNAILASNDGHFVYGLDDPYIHMAMARSFAQHGVWGITPYAASSSSSSPLFTLLLAVSYLIFGVNPYTPIILNLLALAGIVLALFAVLRERGVPQWIVLPILLGVVLIFPVWTSAFSGMEHLPHGLLLILFIYQFARFSDSAEQYTWRSREAITLYVLAFLLSTVRYEGLFSIAAACGLLALRRWVAPALLVAVIAVVPVTLYGLYSLSTGGFFLPNSVYLKGMLPEHAGIESYLQGFLPENLGINLRPIVTTLSPLFLALYIVLAHRRKPALTWRETSAVAIWLGTVVLHASLLHQWDRYSNYLFVGALAPLSLLIAAVFPIRFSWREWVSAENVALASIVIVFLLPGWSVFSENYVHNQRQPQFASHQIYLQQIQMAKFVSIYYPDGRVAANDIGAMSFYTRARILDLAGLGTNAVAHLRSEGRFDQSAIASAVEAHETDVIVIYDDWFGDKIPASWIKAATWSVPRGGVLGGKVVSFYARHPEGAAQLLWNLVDFHPQLPGEVIVSYDQEYPLLPPDDSVRADLIFGPSMKLNQWKLLDDVQAQGCESIRVISWWEKVTFDARNYNLSFVLADSEGQGVAREDGPPARVQTANWDGEKTYIDVRALRLPCDLQAGAYSLLFIVEDPLAVRSLSVQTSEGQALNQGFYYLTTVFAQ